MEKQTNNVTFNHARPYIRKPTTIAGGLLIVALFLFHFSDDIAATLSWPTVSLMSEVPRPTVKIAQGTYQGKVLSSTNHPVPIEAWLGVRYAQPPLGNLRFARPIPLSNSESTFDATEYGFRCPGKQLIQIPGMPSPSEDCLTLNIFRQQGSSDSSKLPILVYVHGGAFNRGTAAMHDTAAMLAHSPKPFLAISFNYRIGALGFLNSELTAKEGVLNLGLHDQRLVLEWVQNSAAAFGGDTSNVTLAGLSAGAHSIAHHMMNINESRTLFHRAVIESGAHTSRVVHPHNSRLHEKQFQEFLAATNCPPELPDDEVLSYLRALPEETIIQAQTEVFDAYNPSVRWAWQPVIDNEIISRRPLDAFKSGKWHKVPVMTGFNHNEGSMYVPKTMSRSEEFRDFFATLLPQMTESDLYRLEALYPDPIQDPTSQYLESREGLGAQFKRVEAAYGQYAYVAPVRQTAHLGTADPEQPPIYVYHWAANSSVINGANHGDQLWYECMDEQVRKVSPTHDRMAKMFNDYVCNFITVGDPNGLPGKVGDRPVWKVFEDGEETMVFGEGNDERAGGDGVGTAARLVRYDWAKAETEFWWEIGEKNED